MFKHFAPIEQRESFNRIHVDILIIVIWFDVFTILAARRSAATLIDQIIRFVEIKSKVFYQSIFSVFKTSECKIVFPVKIVYITEIILDMSMGSATTMTGAM
jgi:hypothetical protein